ncbi:MAG: hypothetical protein JW881_05835, partial [Spirochaetales bacterium]|nr:hypothetical protein [Spirochaetales bacterium]
MNKTPDRIIFILPVLLTLFLISTCDFFPMDKDTYNEKKFDIGSDGFSPPDNESVIPESLVIRWPEGKNILKYHLQVCGNGDFKSGFIVDDDTLTAPSYTVTEPLVENRYYYWRVGIMN